MPLDNLQVFQEYAYLAMTEVLDQQVQLFNEASAGTILLSAAAHQGDYSDKAFFAKMAGVVRRRNAYGSGDVAAIDLAQTLDTMVKVAAGTPPVNMPPSQFKWIQMNPEEAGAIFGQQLAPEVMADMLNTSVAACAAALANVAAVKYDPSAASDGTQYPTPENLALTAGKFGDRQSAIKAWVMHSTPLTKLYVNALTNTNRLFEYGTVNVISDGFGRRFIISDVPGLVIAGSPTKYRTLGLQAGAINVDQNNDFTDNYSTTNGEENIQRTYQAEWSFQLGIKGFTWDKQNGGKSPTTAAVLTASNWDKNVTSNKDLAGVVLVTQ